MRRLLALALLWPMTALSQTQPPVIAGDPGTTCITLSWTAPTQNEDGTPLTDLTAYRIYAGLASGEYGSIIALDSPELVSYVLCGLQPETTYYLAMTAWNSVGMESDFSTELPVTTDPLRIGANLSAYTLVQSRDRIALIPVGTVPVGTECDAAQRVNGMFLLPVDAVTWAGTVRPEVVVGECQ